MKICERYITTILHQEVDCIPFFLRKPRKSNIENWHKQRLRKEEE